MRIYPVILCGGSGTRLWPESTPSRPKQFLSLIGGRSLFLETLARVQALPGAATPVVVAGAAHEGAIRGQLAEAGAEAVLLLEPEGRDSAPAVAAAAAWIADRDPRGIAVVVASDHHIPDASGFRASVEAAAAAAATGKIVTFGVRPTWPATAYGYIQAGGPLAGSSCVFSLARFVEKPDAATAQSYLDAGYLWNSGNFVFAAAAMLSELRRLAPEVLAAASAALAEGGETGPVVRLGNSFRTAPKISIDYAVMEKTADAAVAPVDFAWSDLGAWSAVWEASLKDEAGNVAGGPVLLMETRDSLVRSSGPTVVGIGLKRLAVVAQPDAVLVCDLDASQGVKVAADRLQVLGLAGRAPPEPDLAALGQRLQRWLHGSALPVWWALGADHDQGGFYEKLDEDGRPVIEPRRARVPARQIYSFATAGRLGWTGPWRQAVEHGLDYFLPRHQRPDGLFRALLTPQGAPADDTATLYDQAFALLALAAAAAVLPDRADRLALEAGRLVAELRRSRSAGRGFVEAGGPTPFQANPHMHLLEAVLAWEDATGDVEWSRLADEIVELCLSAFIDVESGALREFFDQDWSPAAGVDGRIVEPGHQFEWAWLLERWARARSRPDAAAAARRLYGVGLRGVDPLRGVAVNVLMDDLSPYDPSARLWPQTEWLKAALIFGDEPTAAAACNGLLRYLDVETPGLWRDRMGEDGGFAAKEAPASSLYHLVCAIAELTGFRTA